MAVTMDYGIEKTVLVVDYPGYSACSCHLSKVGEPVLALMKYIASEMSE
jgi:hypothetical protein